MSSPLSAVLDAWRAQQPVAGIDFQHDELVTILDGDHAGNIGSLVSLEQVEPEVIYLVEIDSGFNVPVPQAGIERVDEEE